MFRWSWKRSTEMLQFSKIYVYAHNSNNRKVLFPTKIFTYVLIYFHKEKVLSSELSADLHHIQINFWRYFLTIGGCSWWPSFNIKELPFRLPKKEQKKSYLQIQNFSVYSKVFVESCKLSSSSNNIRKIAVENTLRERDLLIKSEPPVLSSHCGIIKAHGICQALEVTYPNLFGWH